MGKNNRTSSKVTLSRPQMMAGETTVLGNLSSYTLSCQGWGGIRRP